MYLTGDTSCLSQHPWHSLAPAIRAAAETLGYEPNRWPAHVFDEQQDGAEFLGDTPMCPSCLAVYAIPKLIYHVCYVVPLQGDGRSGAS